LLPTGIKKHSPKDFDILEPEENGTTFEENSFIKASYFSEKTNLICLSDDSGLEVDLLNGKPGIYSARWGGIKKDFNLAIKKIFEEMKNVEKNWINKNEAQFICILTLFFPGGKNYSSKGIVKGKISSTKKGSKGFGYDPIFIPEGFTQTFGEMDPKLKMSIDHRYKAYLKIKNFFTNAP
jgi:XTP/dITP diphosphohydrolase